MRIGVLLLALVPLTLHNAPLHPEPLRYTEQELECLALNVYHEARGEKLQGRLLVTQVVLNRSKTRKLSFCETVYQKKQFSWTNSGVRKVEKEVLHRYYKEAVGLLYGFHSVPEEFQNVEYYHTTAVKPVWRHALTRVGVVGQHIFYSRR